MRSDASKPRSDAGFQADAGAERALFPLFGNGLLAGPGTLQDALGSDSSLKPLTRLQALRWSIQDNAGRLVCLARGCNFDTPAFQANRLYFCTRCNREMFGRAFADLEPEPMGDDDWPWWGADE